MYYWADFSSCQSPITAPAISLRGINGKLDLIAEYVDHGWSIVPQLPGEKKPCFKWKSYQEVRPDPPVLRYWFTHWPDAGPALVLGALSNVVAIDVDGKEAHRELVRRLGKVPQAPLVKSGSGKPYRYHLFFQHPPIATRAKATPWHPKLEFRGHGGIIVLPPSLHKSGNAYQWAPGKSISDMPLPPLPEAIVSVLNQRAKTTKTSAPSQSSRSSAVILIPGISRKTRAFLHGIFANYPRWNERLFAAACDLAGNGVSIERALPLLLAGAAPWNEQEEARALATIHSAYRSPRMPARAYAVWRRNGE